MEFKDLQKLNIDVEICCDECNEVIHNHFDCPACDRKYAGTDCYHDILDESVGFVLACEECGCKFEMMTDEYPRLWRRIYE